MAIGARWTIQTPTAAPGAIAIFQVEGDIDAALAALSLGPIKAGQARLRSLCDVDEGVVVRWDHTTLHLMAHGGAEVQRALAARLSEAGIRPADPHSLPHYP